MKPPTQLDNLLQYTAFAANSVRVIARSFEIPFLGSTAVLVLAILKCVEVGVLRTATKSVGLIEPVQQIKQRCMHRNGGPDP
jgi:hypothetical protein